MDFPRLRQHYGFDSRNAYESLFANPAAVSSKIRAEGSTTYLYSDVAVPKICHDMPLARFIVCLRSPADLLASYHRTQVLALNETEREFSKAWCRTLSGSTPSGDPLDDKLVDYILIGKLGAAMEKLSLRVNKERIHIVVFDDLATDPQKVWTSTLSFLGLDSTFQPPLQASNASDKIFRAERLTRFYHRPPRILAPAIRVMRQRLRTSRLPILDRVRRQLLWRSETRPTMTPELRREISEFFSEDIGLLSQIIGRDLSEWGMK